VLVYVDGVAVDDFELRQSVVHSRSHQVPLLLIIEVELRQHG
jgi:hypothetical protein